MLSFSVDQQTTLVESSDKPTVTPAMLAVSAGWGCSEGAGVGLDQEHIASPRSMLRSPGRVSSSN